MNKTIVTLPCRTIRAMARRMYKGQYWKCVLLMLVCTVVSSVPAFLISTFTSNPLVNDIASIAGEFLGIVLGLGTVTYFLAVFRGEQANVDHVTSAFDSGWKAIGTQLLIEIRVLVRTLLLIVPGFIESIRDALALHVLSDHPEFNSSECVLASQALMEGNKAKYVKLIIGWLILASLPGAIYSAMYGPALDFAAITGMTTQEFQVVFQNYQEELLAFNSQPIPMLLSGFSFLVRVYVAMITAAFFDLACGNLVVRCEETSLQENFENYDIEDITDTGRNE